MDETFQYTPAAQIIAGLLLLFLGRRLFWVFVGAIGFLAGMQFGAQLFGEMVEWMRLLLAMVIGLVAALLAVVLQRVMVMIAGAIAGGMLAMRIAPMLGLFNESGALLAFIIGAAVVGVLFSVLFDPILIVFSALMGAVMIAGALQLVPAVETLAVVLLFGVGLLAQSRIGPALDRVDSRR